LSHTQTHTHTNTHTHTHPHKQTKSAYTGRKCPMPCIYIFTKAHLRMYSYSQVHTQTHIHKYTHTHIHTYTHIHIHTYTHTHTKRTCAELHKSLAAAIKVIYRPALFLYEVLITARPVFNPGWLRLVHFYIYIRMCLYIYFQPSRFLLSAVPSFTCGSPLC